jgi:hypothetical protein
MQKMLLSTRVDLGKLDTEVEIRKILFVALCAYIAISFACLAVGLRLAHLGFSRWYKLYQRPSDIAAKRKLDRLLSSEAGQEEANGRPKRQLWRQKLRR